MKNIKKTAATSALAMTMALSFGITACSPNRKPDDDSSGYTYRTYTTVSPSNWNLLTQSDKNDRQVSNYLNSSFFEFDFAYDDSGKIIDGGFAVKYSAATKLEDVTSEYAGQYGIEEGTTGNRAWKLTLRSDLKWNDGTQIDANDFVYSMKQTLDPLFMNRLASQYYGSNMIFITREITYMLALRAGLRRIRLTRIIPKISTIKSYLRWAMPTKTPKNTAARSTA